MRDGIFIGMIFNQLLKHKTYDHSIKPSRRKKQGFEYRGEGYSVALVDIVDGYGLHACESYEPLIPTDEEVIEPIIWFNEQLAKGPDLLQCLNDAMSALTK